jgi:hypothetical protein
MTDLGRVWEGRERVVKTLGGVVRESGDGMHLLFFGHKKEPQSCTGNDGRSEKYREAMNILNSPQC